MGTAECGRPVSPPVEGAHPTVPLTSIVDQRGSPAVCWTASPKAAMLTVNTSDSRAFPR
jgi:hypothetical protein